MSASDRDPWFRLSSRTPARIAIGRAGASLPTREVLAFALAHAQARDAVHADIDRSALASRIAALGLKAVEAESDATDRQIYLRRPDFGRRLSKVSRERLGALGAGSFDLAIVVADGLSATAVTAQAIDLVEAFLPHVVRLGLSVAPVVVVQGGRVAIGDEIGALLRARAVAVIIGERPGLSAADSLGVYLTYAPAPGRSDGERNCISNVRPAGLVPQAAAVKLAWLVEEALKRRLTGVALKDESDESSIGQSPSGVIANYS